MSQPLDGYLRALSHSRTCSGCTDLYCMKVKRLAGHYKLCSNCEHCKSFKMILTYYFKYTKSQSQPLEAIKE
jgi:TAZ zinc finger